MKKGHKYIRGCPDCGSKVQECTDIDWDNSEVTEYMKCDDCGTCWTRRYEFVEWQKED